MRTQDFFDGFILGYMLAMLQYDDIEVWDEITTYRKLGFKTRRTFLKQLVMCKNPKLKPIIYEDNNAGMRFYDKKEIIEVKNNCKMIWKKP